MLAQPIHIGLANDREYLQQKAEGQPKKSFNFKKWFEATGPMMWWAERSIHADAVEAINNWAIAMPQFPMQEATNRNDADVVILDGRCFYVDIPACFSHESWEVDTIREAQYWLSSRITVNTRYLPWTPGGITGAIAHEFGHLIGLDERYDHVFGCNDAEFTIMDAVKRNDSGERLLCDGLKGPAADDVGRVTNYWSRGGVQDFVGVVGGTSIGVWTWRDLSWSEYWLEMYWYYLDPVDQGQWILYTTKNITARTGVHMAAENRQLEERVDYSTYGVPGGLHMACSQPYFKQWNMYGTWTCTTVNFGMTTIRSDTRTKTKSLWNGTSNDAPPADWNRSFYDDLTWGTAVAVDQPQPDPATTATRIWPTTWPRKADEDAVFRQAFILLSGVISSAAFTGYADDDMVGIWINDVYIGGEQTITTAGPTLTLSVPPAILRPDGRNLIAVQGSGTIIYASYVSWRLDVTYAK